MHGTWLRHTKPRDRHACQPPTVDVRLRFGQRGTVIGEGQLLTTRAAGERGDIWRCGCLELWVVALDRFDDAWAIPYWRPANLWQRLRYYGSR